MAYKRMGKKFVIYTLYSITMLSIFTNICDEYFEIVTKDLFLSAIFGGIVLGIGVGTVLRNGASLDGTEILAIRFNKKVPFTVGEIIMFFNIFIFTCAGFVYEPDRAMYSAITYFTAYKCIDMVIQGFDESKSIFIVSDKHEEMARRIMDEICRGVTYLKAQGGYSLNDKKMIFCVVSRFEISKIKDIINEVDPEAFMEAQEDSSELEEYDTDIGIEFSVTFPKKISKTNGELSEDEKTVTWSITDMDEECEMYAKCSSVSVPVIIAIVLCCIIIPCGAYFVITASKKNKNNDDDTVSISNSTSNSTSNSVPAYTPAVNDETVEGDTSRFAPPASDNTASVEADPAAPIDNDDDEL